MEAIDIKHIIEAVLFAADHPVTVKAVRNLLGETANGQDVNALIEEIAAEYRERNSPIELLFIAGGWQMATKKDFSAWIKKMYREKATLKLSPSALETLAVVAYKQPITRAEIEAVRGVDVAGVLDTILERRLVKIVGRKETIGRPLLYGTTNEFLRHFGLSHLSELPSLEELAPPELPLVGESDASVEASDAGMTVEDAGQTSEGETLLPAETVAAASDMPAVETDTSIAADGSADTVNIQDGETPAPAGEAAPAEAAAETPATGTEPADAVAAAPETAGSLTVEPEAGITAEPEDRAELADSPAPAAEDVTGETADEKKEEPAPDEGSDQ